jgi:PST family polysaccharide transporter
VTPQAGGATTGIVRRTVAGAIWATLAFGAARSLSFGTNLVLARLLAPADFGLVSFALIFITASTLLQDLGMSAAIVYGGRDARTVAGTALTINVAAALGLFVVIVLATPFVAGFQPDPAAAAVLIALSAGPVITALGSVQSALLVRELDYRRKLVPDAVPYLVSGAVSIALAMAGFGVWSLVIGYLVKTSTSTILLWLLSDVRPLPALHWPIAVELLKYGKHIAFQSILGFMTSNLDYLVIGYLLGAHALGLYTMAYMVANVVPTFSQVAISVMFPALSRLRDDRAALDAMLTDAHRILWAVTLPAAILLFIGAPAFVSVVLGERWAESALPLRILSAAACLHSVVQVYGPASKAAGRPDLLWKPDLAAAAAVLGAVRH